MIRPSPPLQLQDLDHVLEHTRELWEEARNESFFITGGTGFFGVWLLESFAHINETLGLGARAVVLTRNPQAFTQKVPHLAGRKDIELVTGDVRNFQFPAGRFAYLIHAATEASVRLNLEAPQEMLDTILEGTRRVLDFAARAEVKKLLLTSSGAVYGRQPSEITHLPEDYPGAPDPLSLSSAYGEGKRVSEHLCAVHASRFHYEAKIARCFAFVGPHLPLDTHFAIGNFLRDALKGCPIRVCGDGTPYRSYLYAADLAIWLWTILFRGTTAHAYNVGSDSALTIAQLAAAVKETVNDHVEVQIAQPTPPAGLPSRYIPSVNRAAQELNLKARISLHEALQRTANWYGKN